MANIVLKDGKGNSNTYNEVKRIKVKNTSGEDMIYADTSDANATTADILAGKSAYVNGIKLDGAFNAPAGALDITENGEYDVTNYANANVNIAMPTEYKRVFDLGTNTSFDVKAICNENNIDYTVLTADNFAVSSFSKSGLATSYGAPSVSLEKSYTASTGVATIRGKYNYSKYDYQAEKTVYYTTYYSVNAYLII